MATSAPRFQSSLSGLGIVFDDAQQRAIARLEVPAARGFYLWGDVGRGKSMLADLYYEAVPTTHKKRFHFHNFFRDLQQEIFATRQPIEATIRAIIGQAQVVFFDEFHVHDTADAVYLTKTLEVLIELNVFVLATSNYAPAMLMPDPLFHHRFAPAIALIESKFEVVPLGAGVDYRRVATRDGRHGFAAGQWLVRQASTPNTQMKSVEQMRAVEQMSTVELRVNGLAIQAVAARSDAATFTFAELCERPLGTNEYLSLAEDFGSIKLVGVPDLASASPSALMRLSNLVDVLYHRDQQFDVESFAGPERMREATEPPRDASRALSRLATLKLTPTLAPAHANP